MSESLSIVRCLQQQEHAVILLCVDPQTAKLSVVKKIHTAFDDGLHSIATEAAVVSILQRRNTHHPHIVRYSDVHIADDVVLVTMEYCPHGDLLNWLDHQPDNRFPEEVALNLFKQATQAVGFLHAIGIAHRDVSLENLLVASDRQLKLCDFGLATLTAAKLSDEFVGKMNYMAPEVVAGELYDPIKADVWSLGVVLFMLLTGSQLFTVADTSDATFRAFPSLGVAGVLRHWRMDALISAATVDLLSQLLCVDPSERCSGVDELLVRLDADL